MRLSCFIIRCMGCIGKFSNLYCSSSCFWSISRKFLLGTSKLIAKFFYSATYKRRWIYYFRTWIEFFCFGLFFKKAKIYAIFVVNDHLVKQLDMKRVLIPHVKCQLFQFKLLISIIQLVPDTW